MTFRGPADHTSSYHSYIPHRVKGKKRRRDARQNWHYVLGSLLWWRIGILIDGIWNWKREKRDALFFELTTIAKKWREATSTTLISANGLCALFSLSQYTFTIQRCSISLCCWNDDDDTGPAIHSKEKRLDEMQPCSTWLSTIHPPSESGVVAVMDWDAGAAKVIGIMRVVDSFPYILLPIFPQRKEENPAETQYVYIYTYTDVGFPVEAPVNPTRVGAWIIE